MEFLSPSSRSKSDTGEISKLLTPLLTNIEPQAYHYPVQTKKGYDMVIDSHVHLLDKKGYIKKIIQVSDRLGIDKICLLAGQNGVKKWEAKMASNEHLLDAFRMFPDRIIPFGFIELGNDPYTIVDDMHASGFRGITVSQPRYNYNDDRLLPYYARAAALGMPLLFDTGTVRRAEADAYAGVDTSRVRPLFLDRIARKYTKLSIIGAHLGDPWFEEAAMTIFWNHNLYFDLSGSVLERRGPEWVKEILWWFPEQQSTDSESEDTHYLKIHPFDRICFGTDVPVEEMEGSLHKYRMLMEALHLDKRTEDKVMGGNIVSMLRQYIHN